LLHTKKAYKKNGGNMIFNIKQTNACIKTSVN
jgi:hypothetical protein